MKKESFLSKLKSKIIWLNLLAMFLLVVGISIGLWFGLEHYTMHDQEVSVPNVKGMRLVQAKKAIKDKGLTPIVADSAYNKTFPAGTVLEQTPKNDRMVKPGREIYLTINTTRTPTLRLPDIADNSSLREAKARLAAIGIKLSPCEYIDGEKDWVYGVKYRGRNIFAGDRIPIGAEVTLQIGTGHFGDDMELPTDSIEIDLDELNEEPSGIDELF